MFGLDFFKKECKGGCTVYFYGTFEEAGDFGTFSKIITSMTITGEQREVISDGEEGEKAYYQKFADLIKSYDEELLDVTFEIEEIG